MTKIEFLPFMKRISSFWGCEFDDFATKAWFEIFGDCNINRLLEAVNELAQDLRFTPKPADIVERYELIRKRQVRKARGEYQKHLNDNSLHHCYYCQNQGFVIHEKEGYEYFLRCSCGRGKDLNMWSRHQINKGMMWNNPETKEDESLYVFDINDALTQEEIGIIKAKNMSRTAAIASKTEASIMLKNALSKMAV